jgi:hypothetical protein
MSALARLSASRTLLSWVAGVVHVRIILHLVANNAIFDLRHPEQRKDYTNVERHATVFFKNQKKQKNQRLTTGVETPWLAPLFASVKYTTIDKKIYIMTYLLAKQSIRANAKQRVCHSSTAKSKKLSSVRKRKINLFCRSVI